MTAAPYTMRWDGEAFHPASQRIALVCDKDLVVGLTYQVEVRQERSKASHDQQFAEVAEAWKNLPERYHFEPWAQSPTHLRKYALIRTGFCHTQTYPCGSHAEAERWAANLRPLDEYSIVTVAGTVVHRFTAESQSYRAMGKKRFQDSKTDVLDFIAGMIHVEPTTLSANAERAA